MKASDVRKKNSAERSNLLLELREKLHEFRFGMAGGQKKNIREAREIRKTIARIKTIRQEEHPK